MRGWMRGLWQLRDGLQRMTEASFQREMLAACAPRHAASAEDLGAFEGLFAASLISTVFWLALIAVLRS